MGFIRSPEFALKGCFALLFLAVLLSGCSTDSLYGTVELSVKSPDGAALEGTSVLLETETGTGEPAAVRTNAQGIASVELLAGKYSATVAKQGYETKKETGIIIVPSQKKTIAMVLQPGAGTGIQDQIAGSAVQPLPEQLARGAKDTGRRLAVIPTEPPAQQAPLSATETRAQSEEGTVLPGTDGCIDTDGGQLSAVKGTIYDEGVAVQEDTCTSDVNKFIRASTGKAVMEYYCDNSKPLGGGKGYNYKTIECPYGCEKGACNTQEIAAMCFIKFDIRETKAGDTAKYDFLGASPAFGNYSPPESIGEKYASFATYDKGGNKLSEFPLESSRFSEYLGSDANESGWTESNASEFSVWIPFDQRLSSARITKDSNLVNAAQQFSFNVPAGSVVCRRECKLPNEIGVFGTDECCPGLTTLQDGNGNLVCKSCSNGACLEESAKAVPEELTAFLLLDNKVNLAWDFASLKEALPQNEGEFRIYRSNNANGIFRRVGVVELNQVPLNENYGDVVMYEDGAAKPSTTYYYKVTAYDGKTETGPSNMASITTATEGLNKENTWPVMDGGTPRLPDATDTAGPQNPPEPQKPQYKLVAKSAEPESAATGIRVELGSGSITSQPQGLACSGSYECTGDFPQDSTVTLKGASILIMNCECPSCTYKYPNQCTLTMKSNPTETTILIGK